MYDVSNVVYLSILDIYLLSIRCKQIMLQEAITNNINILVLLWQMISSNFILSIPIAILVINLVISGIDKLKKLIK